jgi:hypothetical protein
MKNLSGKREQTRLKRSKRCHCRYLGFQAILPYLSLKEGNISILGSLTEEPLTRLNPTKKEKTICPMKKRNKL